MKNEIINKKDLELISEKSNILFQGVNKLIISAQNKVSVILNVETTLLYWSIGNFINKNLKAENITQYGKKILATLSQQLTQIHGKGYSYSALTRMSKIAYVFDKQNIATVSQQLSWSHLIELSVIEENTKRLFYQSICINQGWGVRNLRKQINAMLFERTAIAQKPESVIKSNLYNNKINDPDFIFKNTYILDFLNLPYLHSEKELENAILNQLENFIMELGDGFAFLERQKRMSIDSTDYYLDLLFYHRKLNRLVAIDLKIGKFKPKYKAQMELYLRYLQKYEQQPHEKSPIGLLLCSEGNTEHIELLMFDNKEIRIAQYLMEFPDKKWFIDKLHRAIEISKMNLEKNAK
jgi:predicted nuclease of restriction endonuclease-like (RecB) superfamily